jgi:succinoglycan biosynthesis protein ExoM
MGREGGEDIDFFRRMIARGHTFVWCDEAPVFEHILPERYKPLYHLDKYMRIGGLTGEAMRSTFGGRLRGIVRSGCMTVLFGALAAGGLVLGPHAVMRNLVKGAYHAGVLAGSIGYVPIRERQDG